MGDPVCHRGFVSSSNLATGNPPRVSINDFPIKDGCLQFRGFSVPDGAFNGTLPEIRTVGRVHIANLADIK